MKTKILFALVSLTFALASQAGSERFNGRYELVYKDTMSDNDCSPELEITSRKGIVVIKSLVSIDALGSKVLLYPQWKASQTLELKDQNINLGSCAKKDPISCFTSGATGKTLTTKNTVSETSIIAGSYFRFGPERMVMEMNLTKTSKSLYYSMKFKHRDPNQNLNQTVKMSCYYEQM